MVLSELTVRLNSAEYKNWVKAGHCLLLLRSCLQDFIRAEVEAFHRRILAAIPSLGPHASCLGSVRCTPRARQFQPQCQLCTEWKREILKHHTNRNGDIYWGNCKPERWPFDPWELAKLTHSLIPQLLTTASLQPACSLSTHACCTKFSREYKRPPGSDILRRIISRLAFSQRHSSQSARALGFVWLLGAWLCVVAKIEHYLFPE
ncbi:uncharacterized protein CXorf38 homolog [Gracilinanus agilis]|uniref:uncharacterized protein CXorf38 homolog n=1 Tax=Gracilinanus agilis TaxID=191870 RepID=UPI001CFCD2E7|nr:uncharacterized protein CXorf38 homolog [Gracilinanus agilis]